jgi:purine-binding chemotaxis protein CheW
MSVSPQRPGNVIDWAAIHARMERAEAALSEALNPSPLRAKAIMDARARALAQVPAPAQPSGVRIDVVEFCLGRERYAIETCFVHEVIRFVDYTPVPEATESIIGVTNFRGTVLPVVDLCRLFNIPRQGLTDLSRLIVLGEKRIEFGILADEARGRTEISTADILPDLDDVSRISRIYLRGLTREALIILDGSALLARHGLPINENANRSPPA